jgi:hypothetical protein
MSVKWGWREETCVGTNDDWGSWGELGEGRGKGDEKRKVGDRARSWPESLWKMELWKARTGLVQKVMKDGKLENRKSRSVERVERWKMESWRTGKAVEWKAREKLVMEELVTNLLRYARTERGWEDDEDDRSSGKAGGEIVTNLLRFVRISERWSKWGRSSHVSGEDNGVEDEESRWKKESLGEGKRTGRGRWE